MSRYRNMAAICALLGMAGASLAQPAASAPQASSGVQITDSANLGMRFGSIKPAEFLASRLVGAGVYNKQNQLVGTIDDMVIGNGRRVTGLVVGLGASA